MATLAAMAASTDDVQVLIDNLFTRLEGADGPAAVNLLTHSLRLHITTKYDLDLPLTPREQAVVDALGFLRNKRRGPGPVTYLAVAILVGIAVYVLLHHLGMVGG